MDKITATLDPGAGFELNFPSLFEPGRALAFPCNADGEVELSRLTERARNNYFRARVMVGREFAFPAVYARPLH
jgi:hypothetical protein